MGKYAPGSAVSPSPTVHAQTNPRLLSQTYLSLRTQTVEAASVHGNIPHRSPWVRTAHMVHIITSSPLYDLPFL